MGPGDGVITLLLCTWILPAVVTAGVIRRNFEEFQSQDEMIPCRTYMKHELLHIDCSNRGLSEIPEGLNYDAQSLDLSNNNFVKYPEKLDNFSQIQILDLSSNLLSGSLPNIMASWNYFRTLNLSNNNYETWMGTGNIITIEILDLSINKINTIDDTAIAEMPNLTYFDLSENRLSNMTAMLFSKAQNLETLILSRNYFAEVPNFQSLSLKSLYMSNCQITNLNIDSLYGLKALVKVDLSINQIEKIPDRLNSNTLHELDLSYNEIGDLTDNSLSALQHLAVLNLRGNQFSEVWSISHFTSNTYLREIHVKGNRWSCEGFNVNLLLTYEFLLPKVGDETSLICYSPANVTQLSWQQAYIQTWHSKESAESYTVIAVIIGMIIGIVLTSFVCRGLMAINAEPVRPRAQPSEATVLNLNGPTQTRVESVIMRVPLHNEDLPPTYDEALLMPRLNSSFHSLPDFVDVEEEDSIRRYRRSRSIGDLTEPRGRVNDRRSIRRTVEIHIT